MIGADTVVSGLYLAYASRHTGAAGGFGTGLARFNGASLEAFSMDGDLSATITASSQPGFFLRPTTSYQGGTALASGYIQVSDAVVGFHDGVIAWGIWLDTVATLVARGNQFLLGESVGGLGGFHYVTGMPTLVPPQSGLARYQLIGEARSFSSATGARFIETNNASFSVLWGSAVSKIGLDLSWRNSYAGRDTLYQMRTTGGVEDPASSQLSLAAGALAFSGPVNTFPVCPAGSTCSGSVHGFFAGPSAERAGLAYEVLEQASGKPDESISGVMAFSFSDFAVSPVAAPAPGGVTLLDQTNPNAFAMAYAASGVFAGPPGPSGPPASATQAADGQLTSFNFPSSPGNAVDVGRGTTQSPAAETGGDSLITWGRWTNGTTTGTGPGFGALTLGPNQGFHYVVGAATPPANLPATGTANFTLMGATKPTFGDGALAPGTFTGSMAVQWGGAAATKVGVDFTVNMPGDASYRLVSSGGLANPGASLISTSLASGSGFSGPGNITGTGRACPAPPCFGNVNGFFAGPNAERAGVAYTIGQTINTTVQGAAAFTR